MFKFSQDRRKLILALVYRPPAQNSNVDNELYEQISDICNHNDAVVDTETYMRRLPSLSPHLRYIHQPPQMR